MELWRLDGFITGNIEILYTPELLMVQRSGKIWSITGLMSIFFLGIVDHGSSQCPCELWLLESNLSAAVIQGTLRA